MDFGCASWGENFALSLCLFWERNLKFSAYLTFTPLFAPRTVDTSGRQTSFPSLFPHRYCTFVSSLSSFFWHFYWELKTYSSLTPEFDLYLPLQRLRCTPTRSGKNPFSVFLFFICGEGGVLFLTPSRHPSSMHLKNREEILETFHVYQNLNYNPFSADFVFRLIVYLYRYRIWFSPL